MKEQDKQPDLVDVRAVAAMLACSVRNVWRLKDSGRMPAPLKLGTLVRWRRSDLAEWIAQGCPSLRPSARGARQ